jgi:hypothetical protein
MRQSAAAYILFEDFTHVKFHQQGGRFDGIHHVEGWVPQRLVTATGPNPLPRGHESGDERDQPKEPAR